MSEKIKLSTPKLSHEEMDKAVKNNPNLSIDYKMTKGGMMIRVLRETKPKQKNK